MKINTFSAFLFLILISCGESSKMPPECKGFNFSEKRKVTMDLKGEAEVNLNELTNLMTYNSVRVKGGEQSSENPLSQSHDFFFELTPNVQKLFFVTKYYDSYASEVTIKSQVIYEIELEDMTAKNMYVAETTWENNYIGNVGRLNINSKFNNSNAVKKTLISFKDGVGSIEFCETVSGFVLVMPLNKAQEVHHELINFLQNSK